MLLIDTIENKTLFINLQPPIRTHCALAGLGLSMDPEGKKGLWVGRSAVLVHIASSSRDKAALLQDSAKPARMNGQNIELNYFSKTACRAGP